MPLIKNQAKECASRIAFFPNRKWNLCEKEYKDFESKNAQKESRRKKNTLCNLA